MPLPLVRVPGTPGVSSPLTLPIISSDPGTPPSALTALKPYSKSKSSRISLIFSVGAPTSVPGFVITTYLPRT